MNTVLLLSLVVLVFVFYTEYQRVKSNPELNCLVSWLCPLRTGSAMPSDALVQADRARRKNDTLRDDGRLEHVTYPVPDPSVTLRDLYT